MQEADRTLPDDAAAQRAASLYRDHAAGGQPGLGPPSAPASDTGGGVSPAGSAPELPCQAITGDPQPRYEVRGRLGRGGGGEVFTVIDHRLSRDVAVKVMHEAHRSDGQRVSRFLGEARITANLEHPSILPIYDLGETSDGRTWFSMRRASGPTLAELIDRAADGDVDERIREIPERIHIGMRICECIAYAHDRGILHCDLKPGNILLGDYGEVLVVDWGTAARETHVGKVVGTPLYMAPEQARGEGTTARSDVYGIAATIWHLLTFRPPLQADREAEDFWALKRSGAIDALPAEIEGRLPASILELLREALSPDPGLRPQGAIALRDRLRSWLRLREAEGACDRIAAVLPALLRGGDHRGWQRAEDGLRQALELAPAHQRALQLLDQVVSGHVRYAIARGELTLAAGLIDRSLPGQAELSAGLASARRSQLRQVRLRWLGGMLAGLMLVLLAGFAWQQYKARFGAWTEVYAWQSGQPLTGLVLSKGIGTTALPLPPADGAGVVLPLTSCLTLPVEERGDVRISIDTSWSEYIEGLEVMLRVPPTPTAMPWITPSGYICQFGGFRGTRTLIAINRRPGDLAVQAETAVDFALHRIYHLEIELVGRRTVIRIDGRQVLDYEELLPVGDEDSRCIALRAWGGGQRISRLRVERLGLPPRPSPLVIGDTLVAADQPGRAVAAYLRVARDQPSGALAEEALAKACITACMDPAQSGSSKGIFERLQTLFPHSRWIAACQEAQALQDWTSNRFGPALDQAERILAGNPESRIAQRLLNQRPEGLPLALVPRLLQLIGRSHGVESLNLSDLGIEDLEALRGLHLRVLIAHDNLISDLSPLSGMPIVDLNLTNNRISDLRPLRGMRLERCEFAGNRISDIGPLQGMPLSDVVMSGNPISDLSPLRGMHLYAFEARDIAIADFSDLTFDSMRFLILARTKITDLEPLRRATQLINLDLSSTPVADLSPLSVCRKLSQLHLAGTSVGDLRPLQGLPVVILTLNRTQVQDLSPLRGSRLINLDLSGTQVRDLSPLAHLSIRTLYLSHTQVTDLRPLSGLPLDSLSLIDCPVGDYAPLITTPVQALELGSGPADPLALGSLRNLIIIRLFGEDDGNRLSTLATRLGEAGRHRAARLIQAQLAVQRRDGIRLRQLAERYDRRLLLDTGLRVTIGQARELAASLGARLPCLPDEATHRQLGKELQSDLTAWLGLDWDPQHQSLRWADGSPFGYRTLSNRDLARAATIKAWHLVNFGLTGAWQGGNDPADLATLVLEWDAW